MPQLARQMTAAAPAQRHALEFLPVSRRFTVSPALEAELPQLIRLAESHLPHLKADASAILQVHNVSQSILAVRTPTTSVGVFALLFLNARGLVRLANGKLDVATPEETLLSRAGERAAALYVWAICLPGAAVGALGNVMQWLRQPAYVGCDMYACPATSAGEHIMVKTGFQCLTQTLDSAPLWVYRRSYALAMRS